MKSDEASRRTTLENDTKSISVENHPKQNVEHKSTIVINEHLNLGKLDLCYLS